MKKIKLHNKLDTLFLPKTGKVDKIKEKYPSSEFSVSNVMTADGRPLGFLVKKIAKKKTTKKVKK